MKDFFRAGLRGREHRPFLWLHSWLVDVLGLLVELLGFLKLVFHIMLEVQHHVVSVIRDTDVGLLHLFFELSDLPLLLLLGLVLVGVAVVILLSLLQELH